MEAFRKIKSHPDYEAGDLGTIRERRTKIVLRASIAGQGYRYVKLLHNGKTSPFRANRLVAEAWKPNPKNLPQVHHINNIKTDDSKNNLKWCTAAENVYYASRDGLLGGRGQNRKQSIEEVQAKAILDIVRSFPGVSQTKLAEILGVSRHTVVDILRGQSFPYLQTA